jgi:FAD/FMN-containing dehydrogenase
LSVSVILDAIVRVGVMKGHIIDTEDAEAAAKMITKLVMDEIRVSIVDDVAEAVAAKLSGSYTGSGGPDLPPMVTANDIVQRRYLTDRKMAWQWLRWALDAPESRRGRLACRRDQFEKWYGRYQAAGKSWSDEQKRLWRDELHHAVEDAEQGSKDAKSRGE